MEHPAQSPISLVFSPIQSTQVWTALHFLIAPRNQTGILPRPRRFCAQAGASCRQALAQPYMIMEGIMITGPFLVTDEELKDMADHVARNWPWMILGLAAACLALLANEMKEQAKHQ